MKVNRIVPLHNKTNSKVNAFVDLETNEGIIIKGFKIINGPNGLFVGAPNDKGKDGKYYDSVLIPKEMKNDLDKLVIEEYNKIQN